jgi:UDP-N-acetylmuramoyl-tripeptide--D-alanyl-D-alanine ligase
MHKKIPIEELYKLFINCNQKITTDTRKLEKDAIFFALKGENFDANIFATEAINKGCSYAIVDNPEFANNSTIFLVENVLTALQQLARYHRDNIKTTIISITGSNAKTTHKELINAVLSKKYNTYATVGNLNNHIGVPLTLLAITNKHQMAIVEMGANHQGEIKQLCEIANPDYGLITNIGNAHLEGFGGPEGVKKGKGEMYEYLKKNNKSIFINADDEVLMNLSGNLNKITYGLQKNYNIYGEQIISSEFVEFKWAKQGETILEKQIIKTKMFGHYNFINVLCAACIGDYFNVMEKEINDALSEYTPEMNRSQVKKTEQNSLILDAYNANPSSMKLALENFDKQNLKNKTIIIGDMFELGVYSDKEHETILQQIKSMHFHQVFLIGTHFYQFNKKYDNFIFFNSIDNLIEHVQKNAISNCNILIKGSRGTRLEKIVNFL